MSDMDRRAFVGAAALGGVSAAVLTSSTAEAAGDNSGYFVIAEIVTSKEKAGGTPRVARALRGQIREGTGLFEICADGSHISGRIHHRGEQAAHRRHDTLFRYPWSPARLRL